MIQENALMITLLSCMVIIHFVLNLILQHAESFAITTKNFWDESLIKSARKPLPIAIWCAVIYWMLAYHFHIIDPTVSIVKNVFAIGLVAWFSFNFIKHVSANIIAGRSSSGLDIDKTGVYGLSRAAKAIVLIASTLSLMQTFGFSINTILAFGGMGGLALGFAARDMLANVFGGVMIHVDRPFSVGERVKASDKQIEGIVEYIGWRQTKLLSNGTTEIYVPNSIFSNNAIENLSRLSHRQIDEVIHISIENVFQLDGIVPAVKKLLAEHPSIDEKQSIVAVDKFTDFSASFILKALVKTTEPGIFHDTKHEIMMKIAGIVASHGAKFAVRGN